MTADRGEVFGPIRLTHRIRARGGQPVAAPPGIRRSPSPAGIRLGPSMLILGFEEIPRAMNKTRIVAGSYHPNGERDSLEP